MNKSQEESSEVGNIDVPIRSKSEDLLNRGRFVEAMTAAVSKWKTDESLIIGLHGPWGAGKTSILNLLTESLQVTDPTWRFVKFSPWQWTNEDKLYEAFFDEVGIALGRRRSSADEQLATKLKLYSIRLRNLSDLGKSTAAFIKGILVSIAATLFVLGIVTRKATLVIFGVLAGLAFFTRLASWLALALEQFSNVLWPSSKDTRLSVEALKSDLAQALSKTDFRILVSLDDLDRLSPSELTRAIQLVKANANLPHLVYVFVGDRTVLATHINTSLSVDGDSFLEKIIQIPLTIPQLSRSQLNEIYFDELNTLLGSRKIELKPQHTERWNRVFWKGIAPYLRTMRNIKRLMLTLNFYTPLLQGPRLFEVDLTDFLATETLRVFEPRLYRAIQSQKTFFTEINGYARPGSEETAKKLSEIVATCEVEDHERTEDFLKLLFPALGINDRINISTKEQGEWRNDGRIASPDAFDAYFRYQFESSDVTKSDLQRVFEYARKPEDLARYLRLYSLEGKLDEVVSRASASVSDFQPEDVEGLLLALSNEGDAIRAVDNSVFGQTPLDLAVSMFRTLFKLLTAERQQIILKHVLSQTSGVSLPAAFVMSLLYKKSHDGSVMLTDQEAISATRDQTTALIAKAAQDGKLPNLSAGKRILSYWLHLDAEQARRYVSELCLTDKGKVQFLTLVKNVAISSSTNRNGSHEREYIRLDDVEQFIASDDLVTVTKADKLALMSDLPVTSIQAITLFEKALERRAAGKPDDDHPWSDDND